MKIIVSINRFPVKIFWLLTTVLWSVSPVFAGDGSIKHYESSWSVFMGYGETYPDVGKTKAYVETIDIILRHDIPLTSEIGRSWYRGYHSVMIEIPVSFVVHPQTDPMFGFTVLGSWFFTAGDACQPYIFAGGGTVYTGADIEGLGSDLNGNWQLGAGLRFGFGENRFLNIEYRFHHISNLNTQEPNDPLNSGKILLGVTF